MGIHTTQAEVVADHLEKPLLDDRTYRVIRLPNQLEALLIHDANTDKASAAVDVDAGSLSDADDMPGMAHAVEHMLFMGNEKYPKENEYQQYLAAHSGSHNAFTAQTSTNYFFEMAVGPGEGDQVNGSATTNGETKPTSTPFYGALDRFAQFFVKPLFLEDTLDRELRAVDSENKKNLQSDVWRLQQLRRSLSNPQHPNCKFSTGNLKTLRDDPIARGVKIRDEFIRFYDEQYSANRIKLVVLGRESLNELQSWVEELFANVGNKDLPKNRWDVPLLTENELQTEIFVKPVMDSRSLELLFPYPDEDDLWRSQPGRYLSHLIGHEGPGSILASLKEKGLANSLSAGSRTLCPGSGVFEISVSLTTEGLKQYREVVKVIFQYISILHEWSPQKWIFDEIKGMSEVDFWYKQKSPASSTASKLAGTMQKPYPRELLLSGRSTLKDFDPDAISHGTSYLNANNFRLTVVTREPLQGEVKREKWYGTEYTIQKLPESFLDELRQAVRSSASERPQDLFLPAKNEFIPSRLEVDKKQVDEPMKTPKLIRNDANVRLWYKKDDQFWVPKANLFLRLRNPICGTTARNGVISMLFTQLIEDSLSDYSYSAEIAGLGYSVETALNGIIVGVTGYNDKMSVLLEKVLSTIRNFKVKEERFEILKERLARGFRNRGYSAPYQQIGEYARWITSEKGWIGDQYLEELESVTAEDIRSFQPLLLAQMHIEALAHGNLYREDALKLTDLTERVLSPQNLSMGQWPIVRSLIIPAGGDYVYSRPLVDPENVNHAVEYILQIGEVKDRNRRAKLLLLDQIAHEPAFDTLRTKEQLGYVVFSGAIRNNTTVAYRFIIQSEKPPEFLEERIDAFLVALRKDLNEMDPEQFESHKRSKISERLEKPKNLAQESNRFWNHITNEFYHFAEDEDDAARIKQLTKAAMIEFFDRYIAPSSSERAKVSVHLRAKSSPEETAPTMTREEQTERFFATVDQTLRGAGLPVDTERLIARFKDVEIADGNQEGILAAISTYLRQDTGLPKEKAEAAVGQANGAIASILSQAGVQGGVQTEETAANGGSKADSTPRKEPVTIEDVRAFKASLPVSTGATPVREFVEFEDLESKL